MEVDLAIKNGMVMDGSGKPAARADVIVQGDRIADVGSFPEAQAHKIVDAKGWTVAPGFIDAHTHLDFFLPSPRHAEVLKSWAYQGVTTIVAGNCGWSPAPIDHDFANDVSSYWNFALPHDGLEYDWSSMGEYLDFLEANGQAFNVAVLTGHNVLRTNAMGGFHARFAAEEEIARMQFLLHDSLESGSIGLSLGLFYCPGIYSNTEELTALCSVMTECDALLATHTRGLTATYDKAVEEVIGIAEKHGIPLQLSHHLGGSGEVKERAYQAVDDALKRGLRIGNDNIPWACGPTTVLALLPPRLFDGGTDLALKRLRDPAIREKTVDELKNHVPTWPTWENEYWTDKFMSFRSRFGGFRREHNAGFQNRTMYDIAEELGKDPYQALFDLLIEEEGRLFMIGGVFDDPAGDDYLEPFLADPHCSIISDIVGADFEHGNPVAYGAFTKVLGSFARERGLFPMEEAVRKMTSLPARQMGLKDRGEIRKGAFADITLFDPETVGNKASFADPRRYSEGIEAVFVNGQAVLENGQYDAEALAGQVIRRS
ncbi:MAG: amidohydrolase family protein [Proteobacteria bacterium]|nr:amidohydrolase family protein [Pseudomonadota bacterium]